MIGLDNEIRLANILIVIAEGETQVDQMKQGLGSNNDFDPLRLFNEIDSGRKGYICIQDLENIFRKQNITLMKEEVNNYFQHFLEDKTEQDKIEFIEFLNLIVPKNHVSTFDRKNRLLESHGTISPNERHLISLVKILEKEIRLLTLLDKLKAVLLTNTNCDYEGLFNMIDIYENGAIEPDRMLTFLKKHKASVNEEDILAIFRRINKGANGQISFGEFCAFMNYSGMASLKSKKKTRKKKKSLRNSKSRNSFSRRERIKENLSGNRLRKSGLKKSVKKKSSKKSIGRKGSKSKKKKKSLRNLETPQKIPRIDLAKTQHFTGNDKRERRNTHCGSPGSNSGRYEDFEIKNSLDLKKERSKRKAEKMSMKLHKSPIRASYTYSKVSYKNLERTPGQKQTKTTEILVERPQNILTNQTINRKLYYPSEKKLSRSSAKNIEVVANSRMIATDYKLKPPLNVISMKDKSTPLHCVRSEATFVESKRLISRNFSSKTPLKSQKIALSHISSATPNSPELLSSNRKMYQDYQPKSGVQKNDLKNFSDCIKKIIVFCNKIEETQNTLYSETDINILHLYRIADEKNKGYLTFPEFWELLTSLNINISQDDLLQFLKYSMKSKYFHTSQKITFSTFMKIFTPLNPSTLEKMHDSFIWSESTAMKATISNKATEMIGLIFDLKRTLYQEILSGLQGVSYIGRRAILKEITRSKQSDDIEWKDLQEFLKSCGVKFYQDDLIYVFRELSGDGLRIISEKKYNEFFNVFSE